MSDSKKKNVADDDGMPETHNSHKSAAPVKVTKGGAAGTATKFANGKRVSAGAGTVKRTGSIVSKVVAMLKQKKFTDEEIMKEAGAAKGTVMTQRFHLRAAGEKIPRYIRDEKNHLVEKIRGQGGKSKANKGANAKATLTKAINGLPAGKGKR